MLRGGPEPIGFLSIKSCSLVFFSSSDKLLLVKISLLFTASSFTSFRKFALEKENKIILSYVSQSKPQYSLVSELEGKETAA